MTDQTINLATQIFLYACLGCQAFVVFNNTFNHTCFAENMLLAKKMNLGAMGKQSVMKNRYHDTILQLQSMMFPEDHLEVLLYEKSKSLKQVLTKRSL